MRKPVKPKEDESLVEFLQRSNLDLILPSLDERSRELPRKTIFDDADFIKELKEEESSDGEAGVTA